MTVRGTITRWVFLSVFVYFVSEISSTVVRKNNLAVHIVIPLTLRCRCYSWALGNQFNMSSSKMSQSDNQFLQNRARREARPAQFSGGSWNSGNSWQNNDRFQVEKVSFTKNQLIDSRLRRFDRRGRLIEMLEDEKSTIVGTSISIPEARELVRLQKLHMIPVLGS